MEEKKHAIGKNADIEKLRAFAIIFVIFWHYSSILLEPFGISTRYYASWTGVDLFFCISGYVITKSLVISLADSQIINYLSGFYIKRIFRIWPSAFISIGGALVVTYFTRKYIGPALFNDTASDAIPAIFNYANWAYFFKSTNHGSTLLGIFWSLSLEEQFYLIIPLLVWIFRRRLSSLAFLLILPAAWQFHLIREPWKVLAWSLRTDALIYGVIIAIIELRYSRTLQAIKMFIAPYRIYVSILIVPCLLLILAVVASDFCNQFTKIPTSWAGVLSAALVFIAAMNSDSVFGHGRISSLLLWIGGRSFGLYLFHNLVLVIVRGGLGKLRFTLDPSHLSYYLIIPCTFVLLVALCELNFKLIEVPVRNMGRKIADTN
jgi:peptidoglycan/LPS O-acetylase OafA/YrhL